MTKTESHLTALVRSTGHATRHFDIAAVAEYIDLNDEMRAEGFEADATMTDHDILVMLDEHPLTEDAPFLTQEHEALMASL